jgi:hypothetical protein
MHPRESAIALSTDKLIALSKAKMIAILKFNQKDNGDRPLILAWRSQYDL